MMIENSFPNFIIMKKVLLAGLMIAGLAINVNAQNGSVLVYGNLSVNTNKAANDVKQSSFQFAPGVGYQLNDNWTAGVNLGIGSYKYTPVVGAATTTNSFAAGPFLRYTHPLSNIFSVFGQLDASFGNSKTNNGGNEVNSFNLGITPYAAINLKNNFALNFSFGGLSYETDKVKGASKSSNSFGLTFGQGASFGISKNFGGKKK
jgi:opacity protein-like surface antigen